MKNNRFLNPLTAAGCLSGLASCIFLYAPLPGGIGLNFLPGIFFGVALCIAFIFILKQTVSSAKVLGVILVSSAAYYIAVYSTLNLGSSADGSIGIGCFFVGGMIGALILLLGIIFLLKPLRIYQIFLLTVLDGILGMVGWQSNFANSNDPSLFLLCLVWQGGMAFALALCFGWNEKRSRS